MNNGKTYLLIGGPFDGRRIAVTYHKEILVVPLPAVLEKLDFARIEDISATATAPINTVYFSERLRGQDFEIVLYRHESLNVDQMLDLLVARYKGSNDTGNTQHRHTSRSDG